MKKLIVIALSAILVLGMVSCNNSNPLTDPTNPLNPSNPNSPLNPSNPNNPNNQDKIFPVSEAEEVSAAFINGLDKKALAGMLGKNQGYQLDENLIVNVVDEETVRTYTTDATGLAALIADIKGTTKTALDIRQIESMILPVTFTNCTSGFHADSELESINGKITITIVPTAMTADATTISITAGVYLSSDNLTAKFKNDEDTYKFVLDDFATIVDAENITIDMSNLGELLGYFYLPEKSNEQSVKVTKDNVTRTVKWCDISENLPGTNFYKGTIEGRLEETFYNHFATLGFLHDIHDAIESADNSIDTMKITNAPLALTEENTKLSITFNLDDYRYYVNGTNQQATGIVNIEFEGTLSDSGTKFTATAFTVSSEGNVTLSDAGNRFANKIFTISDVAGTIGTDQQDNGIVFDITGDDTKTASNLTYYYADSNDENANVETDIQYNAAKHSFNAELF